MPRDHVTVHFSREAETLLRGLANQSQAAITKLRSDVMATLDEVLEEVRSQTSKIDSINTLADGIRPQLADVLGGTLSPEMQAKVDAIFDAVKMNSAKLVETIDENTNTGNPEPSVA